MVRSSLKGGLGGFGFGWKLEGAINNLAKVRTQAVICGAFECHFFSRFILPKTKLMGLALRWGTRKGDSLFGTLFGTGYWNYSHLINGKAVFLFISIGLTGRGHLRWLALGRDLLGVKTCSLSTRPDSILYKAYDTVANQFDCIRELQLKHRNLQKKR